MPLLQLIRTGLQEGIALCVGIEDGAFGTVNSVCDKWLVENGIAKFNSVELGQPDTVRGIASDDSERNNTTPWLIRARELSFGRKPAYSE